VGTLASRWNQVGTLDGLSSSDSKFRAFVLRHIDATTDDRDIKNVGRLSAPPNTDLLRQRTV